MWAERIVIFVENSPFTLGWLQYQLWSEAQTKAVGAAELRDRQQPCRRTVHKEKVFSLGECCPLELCSAPPAQLYTRGLSVNHPGHTGMGEYIRQDF